MNFLRTYFNIFSNSVSHPKNYVIFLNFNLRRSISFYAVSYLVIGLLVGLYTSIVLLPESYAQLSQTLDVIEQNFPDDYRFEWDGTALNTQPTQIQIPYPENYQETADKNLAYIDTSHENPESILANIPASSTLIVSQTQLGINSLSGLSQFDLSQLPYFDTAFIVDNSNIDQIVATAQEDLWQTQDLASWFTVILTPIFLASYRFMILILDSLLGYLIFKVWGTPISYKKVLQLGIHIAVPVEIIHQLSKIIYPQSQLHLYSLGFWLMFSLVIFNLRNVKAISNERG